MKPKLYVYQVFSRLDDERLHHHFTKPATIPQRKFVGERLGVRYVKLLAFS